MNYNLDKIHAGFTKFLKSLGVSYDQSRKTAIENLFTYIENDDEWSLDEEISYFLATIAHETAMTFRPIKEFRAKEGTSLFRVQNKYWNTGFYGRGYIQITWENNYKTFTKLLGIDLISDPDRALEPTIAYNIAAIGMRKGLFTGNKISNYINSNKKDFLGARKIVNGTDKAETIASYAEKILSVLIISKEIDFQAEENSLENFTEPKPKLEDSFVPTVDKTETVVVGENQLATSGHSPDVSPKEIEPQNSILKNPWKVISGLFASLGLSSASLTSLYGSYQDVVEHIKPYIPTIIKYLFLGIIIVVAVYIITTYLENKESKRQAHELNLKHLEIMSNPNLYNVKIKEKEKQYGTSNLFNNKSSRN